MATMQQKPRAVRAWILACRPKTLIGAVVPVMIGCAAAVGPLEAAGRPFSWGAAAACLLFAVLAQIAANLINDLFDYLKGSDGADRLGPTRAVAAGWIAPRAMRRAIFIVCGAACVAGLPLVAAGGWPIVLVGAVSLLFAFLYTAGPWPLAYHGWGDVLVLTFFGLVAVGFTAYVQTGAWSWRATQAGLSCGLVIETLLMVNNYRDRDTDRASGKRTLVVRFGAAFGRWGYLLAGVLAVALYLPEAIVADRPMLMLPALYLVAHVRTWRMMVRLDHGRALNRILGRTSLNMLLYGALAATGMWLD